MGITEPFEINDRRVESKGCIVWMLDGFMSGWGNATDGESYAGWQCDPVDAEEVERWVKHRSDCVKTHTTDDLSRQQIITHFKQTRPLAKHISIYVAKEGIHYGDIID